MVGTDNKLIFEYFYLSEFKPSYVFPGFKLNFTEGLTREVKQYNFCPMSCEKCQ